jgi:transcriptional regulator GlxA family with amidase domain
MARASIATAAGFLDRRTFERAFRRQYWMTPGSRYLEHRHAGSAPATLKEEMPQS